MISIPDNSITKLSSEINNSENITKSDLENLNKISGTPLSALIKTNPNLLIFPPQLQDTEDKISDEKILTLDRITGSPEKDFSEATITTGNLMGFVGIGGTKLKIYSRFDSGTQNNENGQDYFLHYMLQKIFHLNIVDFKTESNCEDIFDFLIYLFPQYLNQAMSQGLYKEYQTFKRNDANVRGVIDVARHIRQNIPFAGKIAYNTREYSFDNNITQLIRHTIEYIKTKPIAKGILRQTETRENVQKIYAATQNYKKQERQKIIHKNLKPLRTSFYTKYIPLQKLCRMILLHEQLKFGTDDKTVYGILFDGAWLWEEFLWTILEPYGFIHTGRNIKGSVIHPTIEGIGDFYPDFYHPRITDVKNKNESDFILDTKYKNFDNRNPRADDLQQVIAYMHILNSEQGGFIYPSKEKVDNSELWHLNGIGGTIKTYGIPIPQGADSFTGFKTAMEQSQKEFQNSIDKPAPLC